MAAGAGMDRRAFIGRAGGLLLAAALGGGSRAAGAPDPRLRTLRAAVRGQVLAPGGRGYDAARVVYNRRFDGVRPLAVVRCADVEDVRQTVLWARRNRVPIAARSGGHGYAGYSTTRGVVADLSLLRGIRAHPASGTAVIGAGCRLIDVYAALAARGVTIPAGSCATVGIGGLALGGGVGLASRRMGTTSDNVVSLGIVTADGRYLVCSERRNADLFWACRGGGGGNFGIVTGLRMRVHPVSSASYYFAGWPWDAAADVVAAWGALAPEAPDALFSICALQTGADEPEVTSFGQFFGSEGALRRVLAPLGRVGGMRLSVGSAPYLQLLMRWAGCLHLTPAECRLAPAGRLARATFAAKSDYVDRPLPAAGRATMARWIERRQAASDRGSGAILLDSYGGAINRVAPDATAFVHRDARFSLQYLAYWGEAADAPASLAWIRGFHAAMRPFVSGFAYQNYIDPDLADWRTAYYGANFPRLVEVKARHDPDGLFRFRQGIPARA
jgi:FAD/FMN-containing dehydrogenase